MDFLNWSLVLIKEFHGSTVVQATVFGEFATKKRKGEGKGENMAMLAVDVIFSCPHT
jgi:hypothetical protein